MDIPVEYGVPGGRLTRVKVPNIVERVRDAESQIVREIDQRGYGEEDAFAIKLALEEALVNAIRHGNRSDPAKHITLRYYVGEDRIVVCVEDEGDGFRPEDVPDPTLDENLEKPHGRGLMLMRAYMSDVRFNERGNEIWMMRPIESAGSATGGAGTAENSTE